jgi:uncharacterized membrane protein YheB (UPF0754 family)
MRSAKIEPRHTFSIYLPTSLYQRLIDKAGRGKVSTFIKSLLEEKLIKEEQSQKEQLRKQIIKGYQARTRNEDLQKTLRTYGEMSWGDISKELERRERKNGKK